MYVRDCYVTNRDRLRFGDCYTSGAGFTQEEEKEEAMRRSVASSKDGVVVGKTALPCQKWPTLLKGPCPPPGLRLRNGQNAGQ